MNINRRGIRGDQFLSVLIALSLAAVSAHAGPRPKVLINEEEFRDRVLACWLGKNIGGTLGMPFEGKKEEQNISYYTNLKRGEPAANDDLDLQILWLKAMEDYGGRIDARILGEHWLRYVPVDWNEYGVGKRNMSLGLLPPLSGEYDNDKWKHSNGAWIRSEIWACLAPGCPALAARMAREDACVDHGAAEGTLAEIFTASVESAAFIEKDREKLLTIGLSMIPPDSRLAAAIRAAMDAKKAGKDWKAARRDVIRASESTGWFQAPRNVAFTILGWLYGEGDFGRSLCTAVNCGDDTDCTGATLGSLFGILYGSKGIPVNWSDPVGLKIKTVAIKGFEHPADLNELADRTVAMTRKVLEMESAPVGLTDGPTDMTKSGELKLSDPAAARALWTMSPYRIIWDTADLRVVLDYRSDPVFVPGTARTVGVELHNRSAVPMGLEVTLAGLPDGWRARGLTGSPLRLGRNGSARRELTIEAAADAPTVNRMYLEVRGAAAAVRIPVTLVRKGAKVQKAHYRDFTNDRDRKTQAAVSAAGPGR